MAGYSKRPLYKKLGLKPNHVARFINIPKAYFDWLEMIPDGVEIVEDQKTKLNFVHLFTNDLAELKREIAHLKNQIVMNGSIWISWYKKAAKKPTELDGNIIRKIILEMGLVDVKVCAVSDDWSGLKVMYRIKDRKNDY